MLHFINAVFSVFLCSAVTTLTVLSQHQSELCELSRLAWRGLEESKIVFLKGEIPQDVLEFSLRMGLISQVRRERMHLCSLPVCEIL